MEDSHSHWICEDCKIDFASEEALAQHYANSPKHHYCQVRPALFWRMGQDAAYEGEALIL